MRRCRVRDRAVTPGVPYTPPRKGWCPQPVARPPAPARVAQYSRPWLGPANALRWLARPIPPRGTGPKRTRTSRRAHSVLDPWSHRPPLPAPGALPFLPTSLPSACVLTDAQAKGDHHEALVWVAIGLGLRRGEVLGLRWEDIDLDGARSVTVRRRVTRV